MIQESKLKKNAFGWNINVWYRVFHKLSQNKLLHAESNKNLRILEIGATHTSIVSSMYQGLSAKIEVSCYCAQAFEILNDNVRRLNTGKAVYKTTQTDIFKLVGNYDVIVMKSVLGGLFRDSRVPSEEANALISKIVSKNLLPNGILLTLDNGYSYAEPLLKRFGARKNRWTFFSLGQIQADDQVGFGVLSCFSFQTRFGLFGYIIDEFITYPIDLILSKFFTLRPTVVGSIIINDTVSKD